MTKVFQWKQIYNNVIMTRISTVAKILSDEWISPFYVQQLGNHSQNGNIM